ncbi:hypothetical protein JIN85_11245 [Luteolibacter pohnpeiensis]|uniref:DUF3618 domain-containing protein n=1 Tax=Luteolibacter pohnpeiensis TaxID=454153 RepID=A0A934VWY1_9BACT|nr:hypothetical protein [Luteolibacter pohnpeiensis]MBK1882994.1 hypothetical protein [Luteolibacter pohnpeiensis]
MSEQQDIEQLIRISAQARSLIGDEVQSLRERLDVPSRMRNAVAKNPTAWLGGSLVTGFLTTAIFRRKAKRSKHHKEPLIEEPAKKGLLGILITLLFTAGRPLLKMWLTGHFKQFLATKIETYSAPYPRSKNLRTNTPTQ